MTRGIGAAPQAALDSQSLAPIVLVELAFGSGAVHLWSGIGDLAWSGRTWTGTGPLGRVSRVEETTELRATGITLELAGQDPALTQIVNSESWQGREVKLYFGVLDEAKALVGEPFQIFRGVMDHLRMVEGKEATIQLRCESRGAIDLDRTRARRYTAEDQRSEYPGDKGCDQVAELQEKQIIWNLA